MFRVRSWSQMGLWDADVCSFFGGWIKLVSSRTGLLVSTIVSLILRLSPTFCVLSCSSPFFYQPKRTCDHPSVLLLPQPLQVLTLYSQLAARPASTHHGHSWGHLLSAASQALIPGWEATLEGITPKLVSVNLDQLAWWILNLAHTGVRGITSGLGLK